MKIGFWIYMLFMSLLIPITMIGFGSFFMKKAPQNINIVFGYRTSMSMKNKDTWKFAHTYCGKLWRIIGWISLFVSVGAMLLISGKDMDTIGIFGGILIFVQCVLLFITILPVERALKRNFDEYGNRKA